MAEYEDGRRRDLNCHTSSVKVHNKFGLPSGTALCIYDDTATVIEEDILHDLLQAKPDMMLTVRDNNTELEMLAPGSSSCTDTFSLSSRTSSDLDQTPEHPAKRSKKLEDSAAAAKEVVLAALNHKAGGNAILAEYRSKNTLTNETRCVLVNILIGHMVEMHGRIPTQNQREQYALGIVTLFPELRDPYSKKGYVNQDFTLLFNPETANTLLEKWDTVFKLGIIEEALGLTLTPAVRSLISSARNRQSEPGGKRTDKISAADATDRLVVYHQSCNSIDEHVQQREGRQPYLLAVGRSQDQIDNFYVVLDKNLIPCQVVGSLRAFDKLFKAHFVFNLTYDNALINFYTFIQTTIYKIDVGKTRESPRVKELRAKLLNDYYL
ncbi:uncharacterized protein LOC114664073 [Erpetoichthys calabaricus]|uniref:uncharacterized protein LOC114664073 n=1 Tax=Erpetoichthys calabaricus TaxID=27687 RepID=UPI00109FFBD6|nr:uncharacterized protein LOC114664073 [Erpetoichthys calabaricus]